MILNYTTYTLLIFADIFYNVSSVSCRQHVVTTLMSIVSMSTCLHVVLAPLGEAKSKKDKVTSKQKRKSPSIIHITLGEKHNYYDVLITMNSLIVEMVYSS